MHNIYHHTIRHIHCHSITAPRRIKLIMRTQIRLCRGFHFTHFMHRNILLRRQMVRIESAQHSSSPSYKYPLQPITGSQYQSHPRVARADYTNCAPRSYNPCPAKTAPPHPLPRAPPHAPLHITLHAFFMPRSHSASYNTPYYHCSTTIFSRMFRL